MLKNWRIITRLSLGFSLVMLGTLLLGAIGMRDVRLLGELTEDIFQHPFEVTNHIHEVRSDYLVAQKVLAGIARAPTPAEAERLIGPLMQQARANDGHLAIVRERFLGDPQHVEHINQALFNWRAARDEIVELARQGRRSEAIALYEGRATQLGDTVLREMKDVQDFSAAKAASFEQTARRTSRESLQSIAVMLAVIMLASVALALLITRGITGPLDQLRERMTRLAQGDLSVEVPYRDAGNELGAMAAALQVLKESAARLERQRSIKASTSDLTAALQGARDAPEFARIVVGKLVPLLQAGAAGFYFKDQSAEAYELLGGWGLETAPPRPTAFKPGEGLVGQCALERRILIRSDLPPDYLRITSGTGAAAARAVLAAPVMAKDSVSAVLELASFQPFGADQQALIDEALPIIGLSFEVLLRSESTRRLLHQTMHQAEELRVSEEELRAQSDQVQASNRELRATAESLMRQTEQLRVSEEELKLQREELQATNEELAEKTRVLEVARREAHQRAIELDTASRYKSQFLANMSHELRTPLNSLLILAGCLAENEEGNLLPDQVKSARVIEESGTHLLGLINDILDLSKVEAGKMEVHAVEIGLEELRESLLHRFQRLAGEKGLALTVMLAADLPRTIVADRRMLDQILNNLIGNSLKFTASGAIAVQLYRRASELAVDVTDTGIGIPADQIDLVFQAFRQVDGSASRRYGGSGLGLTISRQLAQLMGGDVTVSSIEGKGSRFSLRLPLAARGAAAEAAREPQAAPAPRARAEAPGDDRDSLAPDDESMLIIEDDPVFARIVLDLAHKQGFKCLIGANGKAGLDLARRYRPTGIILDVGLPEMDGWAVMEQLKKHPETRHIPVHFMSATDAGRRGLEMGAVGFLTKPVTRAQIVEAFDRIHRYSDSSMRRLLLVEDDPGTRQAIATLLADDRLEIVEAENAEQGFARLRSDAPFDCVVLDLGLPDADGRGLLERCEEENVRMPPVVIYSARELSDNETLTLRRYTDSIVIKGVHAPDRLLDEVTLFLHSLQIHLPEARQRRLRNVRAQVDGGVRTVLVVDDDMRNTFALSKVLRAKGMRVVMAEDGRTALDQLDAVPGIDIVLMDIMMPGMDGYQAIGEIRKQPRFRNLPVIALTAKAMVGDREKCMAAGADGYVSKPVNIDELLAMIERLVQRVGA